MMRSVVCLATLVALGYPGASRASGIYPNSTSAWNAGYNLARGSASSSYNKVHEKWGCAYLPFAEVTLEEVFRRRTLSAEQIGGTDRGRVAFYYDGMHTGYLAAMSAAYDACGMTPPVSSIALASESVFVGFLAAAPEYFTEDAFARISEVFRQRTVTTIPVVPLVVPPEGAAECRQWIDSAFTDDIVTFGLDTSADPWTLLGHLKNAVCH